MIGCLDEGLLTHDSDAERLVIGCLDEVLLTHDSDAERFSDWLDEVSTQQDRCREIRDLVIGCLDEVSTHT